MSYLMLLWQGGNKISYVNYAYETWMWITTFSEMAKYLQSNQDEVETRMLLDVKR